MDQRNIFIEQIIEERERQFLLPGSEADVLNSPNDWVAIASRYLTRDSRRGMNLPDKALFEDSLVKAAAVILAALEHLETMEERDRFEKINVDDLDFEEEVIDTSKMTDEQYHEYISDRQGY